MKESSQPAPLPAGFVIVSPLRAEGRPVFHARDLSLGVDVCLKLARSRRAVLREARLLQRVRSPFTPRFVRIERASDRYWIAVEWIEGPDAESPGTRSAGDRAVNLTRSLCHLHRWGVVHGDLKPSNLLERRDGTLCVIDFDYASRRGEEPSFEESGGTAGFVAPERLAGWPADPRSDLYSLGVIFRDLIGKERSFSTLHELIMALTGDSPAQRPARTEDVLAQVVSIFGPGKIPGPDLGFAGWRGGPTTTERLTTGLGAYLGCDWSLSYRLARDLLSISGGQYWLAQKLWAEWLPLVTEDPWRPADPTVIQSAFPHLRELARRETRSWFSSLSQRNQRVAGYAAQIGETFKMPEVLELIGVVEKGGKTVPLPVVEAEAIVGELLSQGMVRKGIAASLPEDDSLRFATTDLWTEALEALPKRRARAAHQTLLRSIEESGTTGDESSLDLAKRRARHLAGAGRNAEAADHGFRAADLAFDVGRNEEAIELFETALSALAGAREGIGRSAPAIPDSLLFAHMPRGTTFRRIGNHATALVFRDRHREAEEWLQLLSTLSTTGSELALYHICMGELCLRKRRTEEQLAHAEAGLEAAGGDPDLEGRCFLLRAQAWIADSNRVLDGMEAARHACGLFARSGNTRNLCTAKTCLAVACYYGMRFQEARDLLLEALAISRREGLRFHESAALTTLVAIEDRLGGRSAARSHLEQAMAIARSERFRLTELHCALNLAQMAKNDQAWDVGINYADHGLNLALEIGSRALAVRALLHRAHLLIPSGQIAAAERTCESALDLSSEGAPTLEAQKVRLCLFEVQVWLRGLTQPESAIHEIEALFREGGDLRLQKELQIACAMNSLLRGEDVVEVEQRLGPEPELGDLVGWYCFVKARIAQKLQRIPEAIQWCRRARSEPDHVESDPYVRALSFLEESRLQLVLGGHEAVTAVERSIQAARAGRFRWVEAQALLLSAKLGGAGNVGRSSS